MPIHFSCTDRDGRPVSCRESVWFDHILAEHPEMEHSEREVICALNSPLEVRRDPGRPDRRLCYGITARVPGPMPLAYLRVVVQYRSRRSSVRGFIITAFPCDEIRQGDELL